MAYTKEIPIWICKCNRKATVTVFNRYNANLGNYCKRHGNELVKELKKTENE